MDAITELENNIEVLDATVRSLIARNLIVEEENKLLKSALDELRTQLAEQQTLQKPGADNETKS